LGEVYGATIERTGGNTIIKFRNKASGKYRDAADPLHPDIKQEIDYEEQ
jgi:hypothetical protein